MANALSPNITQMKLNVVLHHGLSQHMRVVLQKLAENSHMVLRPLKLEVSVNNSICGCHRREGLLACDADCVKICEDMFGQMVVLRSG
jgi:hypothetical protein